MKILVIYPTRLDDDNNPIKYRWAYVPPLLFALLNALTPKRHTLHFVNDIAERVDYGISYDLVAISAMTVQAPRAYQIADEFRRRGVRVVIGGIHASVLPDEVALHADAVVIGEAEHVWNDLLADCENGRMKEVYSSDEFCDLVDSPAPDWEGVNLRIYPRRPGWKLPVITQYASRGCPFNCTFCSVTRLFGKVYRTKSVGQVVRDFKVSGAPYNFMIDDNIVFNPDYSRELFAAIKKLGVRWMSQASTTIVKHPDLIDLAAESGCYSLFIGIESINRDTLRSVNKGFNKIEVYEELIKRLLRAGIAPNLSFVFGFDNDTNESMAETLAFLKRNRVNTAFFWILTPFPGTKLFEEMKAEGRINHFDWARYGATNVVFRPQNFTVKELGDAYWKTFGDFYSMKNYYSHSFGGFRDHKRPFEAMFENLLYQPYFFYRVKNREHPYSGGFGKRIKIPR